MTSAYTSFCQRRHEAFPGLRKFRAQFQGDVVVNFATERKQVLDPRIAFVMTSMLEGVMNFGTAYTNVRTRGFTAPAAGKTGTSHDGWFADTPLICSASSGWDTTTTVTFT